MTKERPPLSPFSALSTIAGLIGWKAAAEIVGRSERAVRNWSEPDTSACVTFLHIQQLDSAYRAAGGDRRPLLDVLIAQADLDDARDNASASRISESAAEAAKETGEAIAATFEALMPGAPKSKMVVAEHQVAEAYEAIGHNLQDIRAAIRGGDGER